MHLSDGSEMKSIIWMLDPHCGVMFYGIHRISAHLNTHGKFWALWANFLLFFESLLWIIIISCYIN